MSEYPYTTKEAKQDDLLNAVENFFNFLGSLDDVEHYKFKQELAERLPIRHMEIAMDRLKGKITPEMEGYDMARMEFGNTIKEWAMGSGFIDGVHYDDKTIIDEIVKMTGDEAVQFIDSIKIDLVHEDLQDEADALQDLIDIIEGEQNVQK